MKKMQLPPDQTEKIMSIFVKALDDTKTIWDAFDVLCAAEAANNAICFPKSFMIEMLDNYLSEFPTEKNTLILAGWQIN